MKKLLFILILSITIPSLTYAKCDGGVEKEGKNGHDYCISDQKMNWWSAFAWCKANERHLATMEEACNNQSWSGGCPNMNLGVDKHVWTALASENNKAYRVQLIQFAHGNVGVSERTGSFYVLCY